MHEPHTPNRRVARRVYAWRREQKGWSQRQRTEALGVSTGAVRQGMNHARAGGLATLRHRFPPGALCRRSTASLARLPTCLHHGPEAAGFRPMS
jgi:transposase